MTKIGLVLEGGAMRGMYTAGVLDTFMDSNIKVDGIIGVSAGALFGVNYYSNQKGRAIRYNKRFCKDRRYMSLWSLLFTGNIINKDFAFYKVSKELDIFDDEKFIKNNTGYRVVVTNVETGKAEYIELDKCLENLELLRATSAMPILSKIVDIDAKKYLDGAIADSIPIDKCIELGYDKIIVVLTRPLDYRKQPFSKSIIKLANLKYKKYPNFIDAMKNRYKVYNETIEKIIDLENKKEIFVIRPSKPINLKVIERNENKLQDVYDLGVKDAKNKLKELIKYLEK